MKGAQAYQPMIPGEIRVTGQGFSPLKDSSPRRVPSGPPRSSESPSALKRLGPTAISNRPRADRNASAG